MTEDEAKTKWCPFARVGSFATGLGSINRGAHADGIVRRSTLPDEAMCIGSACMAWRWLSEQPIRRGVVARTDGFCGPAGMPQ